MTARNKHEVSASCFDFLYIEMVHSMYFSSVHKDTRSSHSAIDSMGFQVGQQLVERYTLDRARFSDHLEAIKFICRDFWTELFKKQVDNLKTNRLRDVFVLLDLEFRWLASAGLPLSPPSASADTPITTTSASTTSVPSPSTSTAASTTTVPSTAASQLGKYLVFPCAIIRGALAALGVRCEVTADVTDPATGACAFHVRVTTKV
mmetsp:Transcript_30958/g.42908  ORF Transcript_30958/g.42908 Transcript_30958/m.42908 type:complete len:205 (-) Transcript_30958:107-721(-)